MGMRTRLYHLFARFLPSSYIKWFETNLKYSGDKRHAAHTIGPASLVGAALFFAVFIISSLKGESSLNSSTPFTGYLVEYDLYSAGAANLLDIPQFLVILILGCAAFMLVHFYIMLKLYFRVERRTHKIETALPDLLQLTSANLRAGMTPYDALKKANRKEFGPLKEELDKCLNMMHGNVSFENALMSLSDNIKSSTVARVFKLIKNALHSGGHLASLLESISRDLSHSQSLKREMSTQTKAYTMFITFTITFGTPILFVISVQFLKLLQSMQLKGSSGASVLGTSLLSAEIPLTPVFLMYMAIVVLIITSILASMLLGSIKEGKAAYGLRYAPLMSFGSLIVLAIAKIAIGSVFGNIG